MKIPQKLDYAMRAMVQLSKRHGSSALSRIEELAEAEAIPTQFLAQILGDLRKAGLIESKRGKKGGYLLAKSPASMTVYDVITAIEGGEFLQHEVHDRGASACVVQSIWSETNDRLKDELSQTTLMELAAKTKAPMFFI